MASCENGKWIRPLTMYERLFDASHDQGFLVTCYCLTLNSKQPLQENQVRRSLSLVRREIPTLRLCIRPKEGKPWFYEPDEESVDFKVLENVDFQEEYEAMTVHHFDTYNGPLWCARLLPLAPDAPCAMPEIKETFPHQYQFFFGIHHGITDGWSNTVICSTILNRLNGVIAGNITDDMVHPTSHFFDEQTPKLKTEVMEEFRKDPSKLQRNLDVLNGSMEVLLFYRAFPPPQNICPKVTNLPHSLSKEETLKLSKLCQKKGVTINSVFCSVINSAIVAMLVEEGISLGTYKLKQYHAINNRRYWTGDTSRSFGTYVGLVTCVPDVTGNLDNFWNEAITFHKDFMTVLQEKWPIKEDVAMFINTPPDSDPNVIAKQYSSADIWYGTTNMGNLNPILSGEGDYVQATDFRRTTSSSDLLCTHVMQTFRGRFLYSLDYDTSLMSRETAQRYVKTIFKILEKIIEM